MGRFSKLELGRRKAVKEESLVKALPEDKYDEDYYMKLADEGYWHGEYEKGLRYYSKALQLDNTLLPAWLGQVKALIELEELKEARLWSDKALERFPDHAELLAAKAIACCRMGDIASASAYCDGAFETKPSPTYAWIARGEILLGARSQNADYCFRRVLMENLKDWMLNMAIGIIYMHYHHYAQASRHLLTALESKGTNYFLLFKTGECYRALGLREKAAMYYEQAIQLKPYYEEAKRVLEALRTKGLTSKIGDLLKHSKA